MAETPWKNNSDKPEITKEKNTSDIPDLNKAQTISTSVVMRIAGAQRGGVANQFHPGVGEDEDARFKKIGDTFVVEVERDGYVYTSATSWANVASITWEYKRAAK